MSAFNLIINSIIWGKLQYLTLKLADIFKTNSKQWNPFKYRFQRVLEKSLHLLGVPQKLWSLSSGPRSKKVWGNTGHVYLSMSHYICWQVCLLNIELLKLLINKYEYFIDVSFLSGKSNKIQNTKKYIHSYWTID